MRASCKHLLSKKLTNQDRSALIGSPLAESVLFWFWFSSLGWLGWLVNKSKYCFFGVSHQSKRLYLYRKSWLFLKKVAFLPTEKVVLFTKKLKKVGKSLNSCTGFSKCIHTVVLQVVQLKERHKVKRKGK